MKRIVLYTQKKCPHCDTAKRYLDEHKIPYRLCSVNEPRGSKELAAIGGRGVPTLKIADQILRGFSVAAFEKMYRS
ncbi:MAG: glutaredoxin [Moritella sp.]|jgi:glutaredoxin